MDNQSAFHALPITGLTFRHYQGEQDLPAMLAVFQSAERADQEDVFATLADFTNQYRHLTNCDPYRDVFIAEVDGQMAGYGRVQWAQAEPGAGEAKGERIYNIEWYIRPEQRGQGLEKAFLCQSQERLRQIIREHADETSADETSAGETSMGEAHFSGPRLFQSHANNFQADKIRLLEEDGFQAVRWACKMTCFDLQYVPDVPMPEGLVVRPVRREQYHQHWDAMLDAFRDLWSFVQPSEEEYDQWLQSSQVQPELWQVAWEGDQIVGMVLNYITHDPENPDEPRTAWTEDICVRRPWRRRGVARALLARSMVMFRTMGFTQTSLGVDLDNLHGANNLYESMGYRPVRAFTIYRKPVEQ
jgi:ribosomal protein S18 acetylase RimI-like enzyme